MAGDFRRHSAWDQNIARCRLAQEAGCESLAFPAISCGIYRFPSDQAVRIAVRTVIDTLPSTPAVRHVVFACFQDDMLALYQAELDAQAPPSKPA